MNAGRWISRLSSRHFFTNAPQETLSSLLALVAFFSVPLFLNEASFRRFRSARMQDTKSFFRCGLVAEFSPRLCIAVKTSTRQQQTRQSPPTRHSYKYLHSHWFFNTQPTRDGSVHTWLLRPVSDRLVCYKFLDQCRSRRYSVDSHCLFSLHVSHV